MKNRRISVQSEAMAAALTIVETAITDIDSHLDALEGVAVRLRGQWDGDAREAFDTAHRDWDQSIRVLSGIAASMSRIAQGSNGRFLEHDQRRSRAWRV